MSSIDLYAVLGVAHDASADEIRAAWKAAVADLDPTDPKLNVFNQAGAVLLDPAKRQKYDAELESAESAASAAGVRGSDAAAGGPPAYHPAVRSSRPPAKPATAGGSLSGSAAAASPAGDLDRANRPGALASPVLIAVLAVLAVASVLAAILAAGPLGRVLPDKGVPGSEKRLADAVAAAEDAAVPVLSYDYRTLAEDKKDASSRMTSDFREQYEQTFTLIEQNAPATQAVVAVEVLASAVARASTEDVEVLLFVNRPTTKKGSAEPSIFRDQVTFTMRLVDGEWLVDDMRTTRPA